MAGLATATLAVSVTSCGGGPKSTVSYDDEITVGILHSLSGTMAISEKTLVDTEIMAIEEINASGGDNLASSFSPELVDLSIYVIDVSAGDKIPRKGGPGITRSDLLLINKIDLADMVGADLNIMKSDTEFMRKGKPWFFTNLSSGKGVEEITHFLESHIPNNRN